MTYFCSSCKGYTERYLDLPSAAPTGYKLGSVLNFVAQLPDESDRLLIMHGTMDENVHFFQHTAQLINLMVKHGKPYQLQVRCAVFLVLDLLTKTKSSFYSRSTPGRDTAYDTPTLTNIISPPYYRS